MLKEDNSGFILFPIPNEEFEIIENKKTLVYLVAYDVNDISDSPYELSNIRFNIDGNFISDDINDDIYIKDINLSIDDLIFSKIKDDEYEKFYFPNIKNNKLKSKISIPMTTCICIGWSNNSYKLRNNLGFWNATFKDLTHEGVKLYYSIKKLHNNKEVRILTFNYVII